MMKKPLIASATAFCLMSGAVWATDFGSPEEAKAMLEQAIVAMQADEASALADFNSGVGEFMDRDLYVFCGDASGLFTAHGANQALIGRSLQDLQDRAGKALGAEIYEVAQEGSIAEVAYSWPRPGEEEPTDKVAYVTKVGDQICAVGYYTP